jgi:alkanesulfonate monooxygenase SsuD/methylene tetrahydromethanopterin reductase-like flavin-dependent oxidoreductase (luciferase family)
MREILVGEENYGQSLPAPEDRYARAAESLDVVYALWDSWRPGALTADERGRAQVEDMFGGGTDLSSVKLDQTVPASLIPDVRTVNGRRGRVEIFSKYAAQGCTLRELIIAAQDTGHWSVAGTPEQIADAIEERFNAGVLDVIFLGGIADDRQHEFAVDGLLAELRKRGIVNDGYRGATLRENLGLPLEGPVPVHA